MIIVMILIKIMIMITIIIMIMAMIITMMMITTMLMIMIMITLIKFLKMKVIVIVTMKMNLIRWKIITVTIIIMIIIILIHDLLWLYIAFTYSINRSLRLANAFSEITVIAFEDKPLRNGNKPKNSFRLIMRIMTNILPLLVLVLVLFYSYISPAGYSQTATLDQIWKMFTDIMKMSQMPWKMILHVLRAKKIAKLLVKEDTKNNKESGNTTRGMPDKCCTVKSIC